jgi:Domain of unknown function (DUF4112)
MYQSGRDTRPEPIRRREPPTIDGESWRASGPVIDADLEFLTSLLDDRFRVPGTNIRFGIDAIIGLIPGVGDTISATLSSYLIWRAHKMGASKLTLLRMAGNTVLDTVVGSVPVFGDILDVKFRANRRNLELLRRHMASNQRV